MTKFLLTQLAAMLSSKDFFDHVLKSVKHLTNFNAPGSAKRAAVLDIIRESEFRNFETYIINLVIEIAVFYVKKWAK